MRMTAREGRSFGLRQAALSPRYEVAARRAAAQTYSALDVWLSVSSFVATSPIERRQTRQRITKECCRNTLLIAQRFPAVAICQRRRVRPKTRRERSRQNVQHFGHFSLPRLTSHAADLNAR